MTNRRMTSARVTGAGVLLALAGPGMAACDVGGDDEETSRAQETRFQCAIERNGVEEAVDCDDVNDGDGHVHHSGGGYYPVFIHSYPATSAGGSYTPGTRLPSDANRHRIGYKDTAGRQRWGLPPSGRIANNTVKTSVVGRGGAAVGGKPGAAIGGGKSSGGG